MRTQLSRRLIAAALALLLTLSGQWTISNGQLTINNLDAVAATPTEADEAAPGEANAAVPDKAADAVSEKANGAIPDVSIIIAEGENGTALYLPAGIPVTDDDLLDGVSAEDANGDPVPVSVLDDGGLDRDDPQPGGEPGDPQPYLITYTAGDGAQATRECYITVAATPLELIQGEGYTFDSDTGKLTVTTTAATRDWQNNEDIAFRDIRSVEMVAGVTGVRPSAFSGCTRLISVVFAEDIQLTSINASAFANCTNLTSITIPATVTAIGASAFASCDKLASVSFLRSSLPATFDTSAFTGVANTGVVIYPDGATVYTQSWLELYFPTTGWTLAEAGSINPNLIIGEGYTFDPDTGHLTVTTTDATRDWQQNINIAATDAERRAAIQTVEIGAGVTGIRFDAFADCTSLTSVAFAEGNRLTAINSGAFAGCTGLTSFTIPATVTTIDVSAFASCENLANVAFLSRSLPTALDPSAFADVAGEGTVTYPYGATVYTQDWLETYFPTGWSFIEADPTEPPTSPPANLGAVPHATGGAVTLSWEGVSDATSYVVLVEENSSGGDVPVDNVEITALTYEVPATGLVAGTEYRVSVWSKNVVGLSATASIIVFAARDPNLIYGDGYTFDPSNGHFAVAANAGTLAWRSDANIAGDDAARYAAVRSVEFAAGVSDIQSPAFVDCSSLSSITFLADDPTGISVSSAAFAGVNDTGIVFHSPGVDYNDLFEAMDLPPGWKLKPIGGDPPDKIEAAPHATDGSVTLRWDSVPGITEYLLLVEAETGGGLPVDNMVVTGTSYKIPAAALTVGTKYRASVWSKNGAVLSSKAATLQEPFTAPVALPPAPAGVNATANADGTVDISWDAVATADSYRILVTDNLNGSVIIDIPKGGDPDFTGLSYTIGGAAEGLLLGHSYKVSVSAKNDAGISQEEATGTFTPAGAVPPPLPSAVPNADGTVALSWRSVTGATEYHVAVKKGNEEVSVTYVSHSPTDNTRTVESGLANGTAYTFEVAAENYLNVSAAAVSSSFTPTLDAVVDLTGETGVGKATLTWDSLSGATGYRVQRKARGADDSSYITREANVAQSVTPVTYVDTGDPADYTYRVIPFNHAGDSEREHATVNASILAPDPSLAGITVNGTPLAGFARDTYSYEYDVSYAEWNANQAQTYELAATPVQSASTVSYSYNNFALTSADPNAASEKTVTVTVTAGGVEPLIYTVLFRVLPCPHENITSETVLPDCDTDGHTKEYCDKCGTTLICTILPATGHDWGEWTTEDGTNYTRECAACGEIETASVIDDDGTCIGHDFTGERELVSAATCAAAGEEKIYCATGCGAYIIQSTPKTDHHWSEWVVTVPATVDSMGLETRTCPICNITETRRIAKLVPTYSVTYDLNNGTGTAPTEADQEEDATFAAAEPAGVTPPTGQTFKEWNTQPDGGGQAFAPGEPVTMPGEDLTLYAIWQNATYNVTLYPNGGTGGTSLTEYTYGTGAALPADYEKDGHTFAGWYDNAGFTGNAITAISPTDTGDKEFWARWDAYVSSHAELIEWLAKPGGTLNILIDQSFAIESLVTIPAGKTVTIQSAPGGSYILTRAAGYTVTLFRVPEGRTLTLEDIILDGENKAASGPLISVEGGALHIKAGVSLTGNIRSIGNGGGVIVDSGIFTMSGGEITGNTAPDGGGVYVRSGVAALGGTAKITDNTGDNVFLNAGVYIAPGTGDPVAAPAAGMSVGVTKTADSGVFVRTGATQALAAYFEPDDETKTIVLDGEALRLVDPAALADLSVDAAVSDATPQPGGDVIYYPVSLTNDGPATAAAPTLTATLPARFTGIEYSTDNGDTFQLWVGSHTFADLPDGEKVPVLFRAALDAAHGEAFAATFAVSSTTLDPNTANNSDTASVTVKDEIRPAVTGISPSANVPVSGNLVITFSEPIDTSIPGTVTMGAIPYPDHTWSPGGTELTVAYGGLDYNQSYTLSIQSFQDIAGNPVEIYVGEIRTAANKNALEAAISAAAAAKAAVPVQTDGAGLYFDEYWVTQATVDTLDAAIAQAAAVAADQTATQAAVDGAVTTLNNAVSAFNSTRQAGWERRPYAGDTPEAPTVTGVTKDSFTVTLPAGHEFTYSEAPLAGTEFDSAIWYTAPTVNGLKPNTRYYVYRRVARTLTHLESPVSPAKEVTTEKLSIDDVIASLSIGTDGTPDTVLVPVIIYHAGYSPADLGVLSYAWSNGTTEETYTVTAADALAETTLFVTLTAQSCNGQVVSNAVTAGKAPYGGAVTPATVTAGGDGFIIGNIPGHEYFFSEFDTVSGSPVWLGFTGEDISVTGLNANQTYYVFTRVKETDTVNASEPSEAVAVRVLNNDAALSALTAGRHALDPAFSAGVYAYDVLVPFGEAVPEVTATPNDPNAAVHITQAAGFTAGNTATVTVTAENGLETKTYTVAFTEQEQTAAPVIVTDNISHLSRTDGTIEITGVGDVYYAIDDGSYAVYPGPVSVAALQIPLHVGTLTVSAYAMEDAKAASETVTKSFTLESYDIALDPAAGITFASAAEGYATQAPRTVTVTNTGNMPTGSLTVALDGADAGNFALSKESIDSISAGEDNSFTVVPSNGLAAGTYEASAVISGGNGISRSLTVSFAVTQPVYAVTLHPDGGTGGTPLTEYIYGTGATLPTDYEKEGHTFAGWYGNAALTGNAVTAISPTDTGAKEFWAKWTPDDIPGQYSVTVSANPAAGGTASGGGTFEGGARVTVTAAANPGYTFANWMQNGSVVSANASYTFPVGQDCALTANFLANESGGGVNIQAKSGNGAPSASLPDGKALRDASLTADDYISIAGGSFITLSLTVEAPSSPPADADKVLAALQGRMLGMYLDISLHKQQDGGAQQPITLLSAPIDIVLGVPVNLRKQNRIFYIIRVHGGNVDLLPDKDIFPNTITFETDRFSTYAIVYTDPVPDPDIAGNDDVSDVDSSGVLTVPAPEYWIVPHEAARLAAASREAALDYARSARTDRTGISAASLQVLGDADLRYIHDTMAGGAVQVRLYFEAPGLFTQDTLVSGYVRGPGADTTLAIFDRWFTNRMRVIHFDHPGLWEQPVRVAAKLDLTGMDTSRLFLYGYYRPTNQYWLLTDRQYAIDEKGYLHFATEWAGDIIVSDGPLAQRSDTDSAQLHIARPNLTQLPPQPGGALPAHIAVPEAGSTPSAAPPLPGTGSAQAVPAAARVAPPMLPTPGNTAAGAPARRLPVWALLFASLLAAAVLWVVVPRKTDEYIPAKEYEKQTRR